jgi:hypothetical protein
MLNFVTNSKEYAIYFHLSTFYFDKEIVETIAGQEIKFLFWTYYIHDKTKLKGFKSRILEENEYEEFSPRPQRNFKKLPKEIITNELTLVNV